MAEIHSLWFRGAIGNSGTGKACISFECPSGFTDHQPMLTVKLGTSDSMATDATVYLTPKNTAQFVRAIMAASTGLSDESPWNVLADKFLEDCGEGSKLNTENRIAQAIAGEVHVQYLVSGLDADTEPVDNLDEIAATGKVVLVQKVDPSWEALSGEKGKDYRSEVLDNPTWLQVAVCANEMIKTVRDFSHIRLESLNQVGKEGEVTIYSFVMGS